MRPPSAAHGGGAYPGDDTGRTGQDKATQTDPRAVAPVDPPGQHHEAHNRDGDHRDGRRDRAHQRALQPVDRVDDDAGAFGVLHC